MVADMEETRMQKLIREKNLAPLKLKPRKPIGVCVPATSEKTISGFTTYHVFTKTEYQKNAEGDADKKLVKNADGTYFKFPKLYD
jgi:hypothetical protein